MTLFNKRYRACLVSFCWKFEGLFNKNKYFYYYLDNSEPNEENINNIFLRIYKLSEQIQRPIKILIFSLDLPVYLSDSHSGGKYRCSIAVSNLCIVYISGWIKGGDNFVQCPGFRKKRGVF